MTSLLFGFLLSKSLSTPLYKNPKAPIEARVKDLISRMTLDEEARQLDMYAGTEFVDKKLDNTHTAADAHVLTDKLTSELGDLGAGSIHDLYPTARISNEIQRWVIPHNRLGIPAIFIEEGVHGYLGYGETVYPCSINLASTWDAPLAKLTASQIGAEARANGVDMLLGPVLDVAREPRWGRIEEDFGEDPFLTGEMGASYVAGMQGISLDSDHTVVSEPKHFAGHGSPEGGLNTSPVHAGEREVRSVLLRSFEPAIRESGARGVMAAYHEIDGVPCAGNPWLLTQVLRDEWEFKGFVLSDLGAIQELYDRHHVAATPGDAVRLAITSGVDMQFYDFDHKTFQSALSDGVRKKLIFKAALDRAVAHVLSVKFELGLFDHPYIAETLQQTTARSAVHLATSLKSAEESMVLLRNDGGLLPLKQGVSHLAVIGPNATTARLGDYTADQGVHAGNLVDAIRAASPGSEVASGDGADIAAAVQMAQSADVVVLGLGERGGISGEGSDRSSLDLPDNQPELLKAIVAVGKPVVLVLTNGRPLVLPSEAGKIGAIIEAWYPGEFGSKAIADTLFGFNNPSGKLPISFPRSIGALPDYYNHDPSKGHDYVDGTADPVWPFGFGLSYSHFVVSSPMVQVTGPTSATVDVQVTNDSEVAGDEVVELYERANTSSVETPVRSLQGFQRVHLEPGQTTHIGFHLGSSNFEIWGSKRKWTVERGRYTVWVGDSSQATKKAEFDLEGANSAP